MNDGSHPYTFDQENRLATAGGVTYTYDGDGKRVEKSSGTLYWTGPGSDPLMETDLSGNPTEEYVFFNGERVARLDLPANTVEYYFSDHLKSTDVVTNATGGIVHESDYVPYGGEVVISGTDPNRYKFTGKERDPESGLDDFDARFYSSPFGRFMTPDWEVKPTDVPYANFGNPQSLNLYSYVQNNPTTVGDPDGHDPNPDIRYKDSQSQQQFERISNESESFRNEVNAAKADHNMDVTVQQVGVQQMPDHAPADATAQRDANGVVHMTINTNPSDDSNAAHELGHVKDARTNTDQFFKDALQDKKDKGGPNEKAHDDPLRSGRTTSGTK